MSSPDGRTVNETVPTKVHPRRRGRLRRPTFDPAITASSSTANVQIRGAAKAYGAAPAVRAVDLSVTSGETVALLGPNGAGKSTTIELLVGLARPDAGSIAVFGLTPDDAVKAGRVSVMLQTGGLVPDLSVRELVHMIASIYPSPLPVAEALDLTGTAELRGRRTQELSGGEAQRVRFALALVSNPDLLVLDEPTVGMDVEAREAFWIAMREFAERGKSVLFATHLEEADDHADRIVLMSRGRVVADGPTSEIKARVGRRTIRATLPDVTVDALATLPGVADSQRRGQDILLLCADSDSALRALLGAHPAARNVEVHGSDLKQAFLELTGDPVDALASPSIDGEGS